MRKYFQHKQQGIDILTLIPVVLMLVLLAGSFFAPVIVSWNPTQINMTERLQGSSSSHLLGTDYLGRDLLSRVLYGGRVSALIAVAATILSMMVGMVLGLLAGYFGKVTDTVITCLTSMFQGLPGTSMMIAVSAIMGPGVESLITALVINSWASFSRVVREKTLSIREEVYVEGARCLGAGKLYIIVYYVIPNILPDIIVLFATKIGGVVLSIASLSFLGLGIQPPTPDWGMMINEARTYFRTAPLLILAPGCCLIILSFGVNSLGEILRNKFDVRSRSIRLD